MARGISSGVALRTSVEGRIIWLLPQQKRRAIHHALLPASEFPTVAASGST
jgi:hypothetical protein